MFLQIRLKRIRLKERDKLNEKNFTLLNQITKYMKNSSLRGYEKEEILQQVMDMMLQAESQDKDIDNVIGKDYEEFCKSIITEYNNSKSDLYKIINFLQMYLIWFLGISLVQAAWRLMFHPSLGLGVSIDDFSFASSFALLLLTTMRRSSQFEIVKYSWSKPIKYDFKYRITFASIAAVILLSKYVFAYFYGDNILKYNISFYRNSIVIIIIVLIIVCAEGYKYFYDSKLGYSIER